MSNFMSLCALFATAAGAAVGKSCTAVPLSKCGKDYTDNCLKCGTKSDYDCEQCCPGCKLVKQDPYQYCTCDGPGPSPPGPSPDSWDNYQVDGMDVISVTGGKDKAKYKPDSPEFMLCKDRNEPCIIVQVVEVIAALKGITPQELTDATWANTLKMFGIA